MKNYISGLMPSIGVFIISILLLGFVVASGYSYAVAPDHSVQAEQHCPKKGFHRMHAKGPHGKPGKGLSHMYSKMERDLDLTVQQKQSIQHVIADYEPQIDSIHEQLHEGRKSGKDIINQDVLDDASLQTFVNSQTDLFKQMVTLKTKAIHAMHAQLTDDQKAKLEQLMERKNNMHQKISYDAPQVNKMTM